MLVTVSATSITSEKINQNSIDIESPFCWWVKEIPRLQGVNNFYRPFWLIKYGSSPYNSIASASFIWIDSKISTRRIDSKIWKLYDTFILYDVWFIQCLDAPMVILMLRIPAYEWNCGDWISRFEIKLFSGTIFKKEN